MSRNLDIKVRQCYTRAVAQGALLFTESSISKHREHGEVFEVRFVPALAKKPSNRPKGSANPFLPYDERLHVAKLGSTHHLLLNKYCVVPHHLLITTAEFRQQGEPLTEADFSAVLNTINNLTSRNIVFYNSGDNSGASQPHKHLQVLPMPEYMDVPPSIGIWLQYDSPSGQVHTSDQLPFAHYGIVLDQDQQQDPVRLAVAYKMVYDKLTAAYGTKISYNMIMTKTVMMLFPRQHSSWNGIAINSLGFAGLVLTKTKEEQELLDRYGILHILTCVGYPRTNKK
ncbi:bifunctional AP-4-A phosphorylase/ADP sulfurylase [Coemansia brasiliensis]|uniref:Bifunctional AP-4-A phosphorylase/ADP sulfurylase n=1 Tax=Coemansia brasiliensis TaxID=2650707 RepID=A0A9W8IDU5_9FUNG|nr:bifunctional AP-4-A phosphorylase/ADP sulfurylase [Coemansia brasiliensis]